MKIVPRHTPVGPYTDAAKDAKRVVAPASATKGDAILISSAAHILREALAMEEPFDAAKVARLSAMVAEGRYTVDTPRLAERLAAELIFLARETKSWTP